MTNSYLETGTVFRKGDTLNASGNDATHAVRLAIAEHRRLLQGPHGPMSGTRTTTLRDGTVITTWINSEGLAPTLVSHVYSPQERETVYEDGLLWSGLAYEINDPGFPVTQRPTFYAGKSTDDENTFRFGTFCPVGSTVAFAPEELKPERTLISEIGKIPYTIGQPGMFSGKMRRVIQHMLGAGQVPAWNWKWNDCCWIFTATDDGEWVVNMSNVYGLRAAPLTYITEYMTGCNPSFQIASGNGDWHELLAVGDCSDYFDTDQIALDIGFAVNTKGDEARNLSKVYAGGTADTLTVVYEWLIEIAETLESGVWTPTSATLTQVSASDAWTSVGGCVRVPNGPYFSDIWEVNLFGDVPKPEGETEWSWPVFVYYDGDTVKRVIAHHYDAPETETTDPDPKGATAADVWKANGAEDYPFVNSFPTSGLGTFSLGIEKTYSDQLYFEGVGFPAQEFAWAFVNSGTDTFALEPKDDASGTILEALGGVATGGAINTAVRYRDQESTGASNTVKYAVWIPQGDREAILTLKYDSQITRSSTKTRSVRQDHMFTSVVSVVPGGTSLACCGDSSSGLVIQQLDGTVTDFTQLPATVGGALAYTGWTAPNGVCPFDYYQKPYFCSVRDFVRQLGNSGAYDEDPSGGDVSVTTTHYEVYAYGSGGLSIRLDEADAAMPMPDWLQTASDYDPNPLWMTRTYTGEGITCPFPSTALLVGINNADPMYVQFAKAHTALCLWVGEPHG